MGCWKHVLLEYAGLNTCGSGAGGERHHNQASSPATMAR